MYLFMKTPQRTGLDPGRCNRCKYIGQKKITDTCNGQIFTANNEKHHFLQKRTAFNAHILTKLLFRRTECQTYSQIYL